jgi:hypothetical protein
MRLEEDHNNKLIVMDRSVLLHKYNFLSLPGSTGIKYDKQDQQGKAAFNERNPHMTKQQEPNGKEPNSS